MHKPVKIVLSLTLAGLLWNSLHPAASSPENNWGFTSALYPTFASWKAACDSLPIEKKGHDAQTALNAQELNDVVTAYLVHEWDKGAFSANRTWVSRKPLNITDPIKKFFPYAQKLVIPNGSEIAFHGDIHSDIHSLNTYIQYLNDQQIMNDFSITKNDFYIIFLGDYVDRGFYGAEVLYTILRLKCANPDRVFMVRGNHEDKGQNEGKFAHELLKKFGKDANSVFNCYSMLPVVLFLGSPSEVSGVTDYIVCCHGGLEIGFDPRTLLDNPAKRAYSSITNNFNELDREAGASRLDADGQQALLEAISDEADQKIYFETDRIPTTESIGYMWNDFTIRPDQYVSYNPNRGLILNAELTKKILENYSTPISRVHAVFRAHQHYADFMTAMLNQDQNIYRGTDGGRGVAKLWWQGVGQVPEHALWDNMVGTFLVSPNARTSDRAEALRFGDHFKYHYDAFGVLQTAPGYNNWQLIMTQINPHAVVKQAMTAPFAAVATAQAGLPPEALRQVAQERAAQERAIQERATQELFAAQALAARAQAAQTYYPATPSAMIPPAMLYPYSQAQRPPSPPRGYGSPEIIAPLGYPTGGYGSNPYAYTTGYGGLPYSYGQPAYSTYGYQSPVPTAPMVLPYAASSYGMIQQPLPQPTYIPAAPSPRIPEIIPPSSPPTTPPASPPRDITPPASPLSSPSVPLREKTPSPEFKPMLVIESNTGVKSSNPLESARLRPEPSAPIEPAPITDTSTSSISGIISSLGKFLGLYE